MNIGLLQVLQAAGAADPPAVFLEMAAGAPAGHGGVAPDAGPAAAHGPAGAAAPLVDAQALIFPVHLAVQALQGPGVDDLLLPDEQLE